MASESLLMREALGSVLRMERLRLGLTLRELGLRSQVSGGYISEIERGHKEPSSELLAALCDGLEIPLSRMLRLTSDEVAVNEVPEVASVTGVADVVASAA